MNWSRLLSELAKTKLVVAEGDPPDFLVQEE
jgi:hypothetical protein